MIEMLQSIENEGYFKHCKNYNHGTFLKIYTISICLQSGAAVRSSDVADRPTGRPPESHREGDTPTQDWSE